MTATDTLKTKEALKEIYMAALMGRTVIKTQKSIHENETFTTSAEASFKLVETTTFLDIAYSRIRELAAPYLSQEDRDECQNRIKEIIAYAKGAEL